jgi:hypothetical protein
MNDNNPLELAEVIKALRQEIISAQEEGADKNLRFNVNNVEVELETVIGKEEVASGGFKTRFFVIDINANASAKYTDASKLRVKLNLGAVNVIQTPAGAISNTAQIHDKA